MVADDVAHRLFLLRGLCTDIQFHDRDRRKRNPVAMPPQRGLRHFIIAEGSNEHIGVHDHHCAFSLLLVAFRTSASISQSGHAPKYANSGSFAFLAVTLRTFSFTTTKSSSFKKARKCLAFLSSTVICSSMSNVLKVPTNLTDRTLAGQQGINTR